MEDKRTDEEKEAQEKRNLKLGIIILIVGTLGFCSIPTNSNHNWDYTDKYDFSSYVKWKERTGD